MKAEASTCWVIASGFSLCLFGQCTCLKFRWTVTRIICMCWTDQQTTMAFSLLADRSEGSVKAMFGQSFQGLSYPGFSTASSSPPCRCLLRQCLRRHQSTGRLPWEWSSSISWEDRMGRWESFVKACTEEPNLPLFPGTAELELLCVCVCVNIPVLMREPGM